MDINNIAANISKQYVATLEEKIIELLVPYMDTKRFKIINENNFRYIVDDLKGQGYSINHIIPVNGEYEEFNIQNKITKEKDYFLIKKEFNIEQNDNKYTHKTYISEIIRGIGDK